MQEAFRIGYKGVYMVGEPAAYSDALKLWLGTLTAGEELWGALFSDRAFAFGSAPGSQLGGNLRSE